MGRRDRLISVSILRALFKNDATEEDRQPRPSFLMRILAFFSLFNLQLMRYRPQLFKKLRKTWGLGEEYIESFRSPGKGKTKLVADGDLGYSGSVSSITSRCMAYLINHRASSLPRIPVI